MVCLRIRGPHFVATIRLPRNAGMAKRSPGARTFAERTLPRGECVGFRVLLYNGSKIKKKRLRSMIFCCFFAKRSATRFQTRHLTLTDGPLQRERSDRQIACQDQADIGSSVVWFSFGARHTHKAWHADGVASSAKRSEPDEPPNRRLEPAHERLVFHVSGLAASA